MKPTKWEQSEDGDEITLITPDSLEGRIVSIQKLPDGQFAFIEQCDQFFSVTMDKNAALQALYEAAEWIKEKS